MLKPQRNSCREIVSLDGFWQFRVDPEGTDQGWAGGFASNRELAVPGSWNEQRSELMHFFGRGWYQTRFHAPAAWTDCGVTLHVGSAQRQAQVWLNGRLVGGTTCGCLPFECDLRPALQCGRDNLLVILVDGSLDPWDLPPARLDAGEQRVGFHDSHPAVAYDFFPYAGLSRSVALQITPTRARISSLRVTTTIGENARTANVTLAVEGENAPPGSVVKVVIEDLVVTGALSTSGRAVLTHTLRFPRLWRVGHGELYEAIVTLELGRTVIDCYRQTFGVRTIEVRDDRLLLNGQPIFLTGFGKHEDFAVVGRGVARPVIVRDFDLLHWIGANSFRTSHYPYAEEWYEFADRHGVLVIDETPFVGLNRRMYSANVLGRATNVLGQMIARDANHPSVIMWSLANEPEIEGKAGNAFFAALLRTARTADPTRPITYVAHGEPRSNRPLAGCDVVCLNKYYGWYEQPGRIAESLEEFGACLDRYRAAFNRPILLAEFGADAIAGLHLEPPEMFSEEFQAELVVAQYREARRRPWVIGTHVWTFADFKTAQSITRVGLNRKGVFTRDRQPKYAAHRLRALWTSRAPAR